MDCGLNGDSVVSGRKIKAPHQWIATNAGRSKFSSGFIPTLNLPRLARPCQRKIIGSSMTGLQQIPDVHYPMTPLLSRSHVNFHSAVPVVDTTVGRTGRKSARLPELGRAEAIAPTNEGSNRRN